MQILLCVKQVPDDSIEIHLDKEKKPNLNGVSLVANAFDTYALELAVRFMEAHGGNVSVLTVGADESLNTLKNCLAVGANEAFFVKDDLYADLDAIGTAHVLVDAIHKIETDKGEKFDLILCGKESTDEITGQVGAMLAEKLGTGYVSSAIEIDLKDDVMEVHQETDEGYNVVSIKSPAVVTVSKPDYDPRYPTIKSKMKSRKAVIPTYSAAEIGEVKQAKVRLVEYVEPPKKEAGIKIKEKDATLAVSAAMEQMKKDKAI
ncbi:electron transfer flavoprotein subunit beta/FixA family protein [Clostridium saccharobutylicum]|uniref:Electron transfer flavoprotein small subunit n=1 Tax=Clostridium saccharobutylicum DSM 13864 TaxID=1345695 RepID=U5MQ46_CLOSA|nr:electron transfer flavoprotein subunit beta/FixA family protein [Clostridium saccharobutylicum]AGX42889.1 electron transfer flavoprotein subunit beta [Clostridium saccharobutylicum DSM 13864]AQR90183.1 acryloyl-CoA reductase electron transfer subunit gamma [Clostridium saccharobutylicum]AQS00089.1 acryloyl-CoA reductase electron transfer subunit gamma [Clostridium saccharobutylicum]AQS09876.1 acryloyl-CoA reductase electron transfer subunit gamma [Clostridium saccharobutylicum]AQS14072.1 ac